MMYVRTHAEGRRFGVAFFDPLAAWYERTKGKFTNYLRWFFGSLKMCICHNRQKEEEMRDQCHNSSFILCYRTGRIFFPPCFSLAFTYGM